MKKTIITLSEGEKLQSFEAVREHRYAEAAAARARARILGARKGSFADVKRVATILHGHWWSRWYEEHGGRLSQLRIEEVMPPIPALVVAIAQKLWESYPPTEEDTESDQYPEDLAFSVTGTGGASGYCDMKRVPSLLEQVEYQTFYSEREVDGRYGRTGWLTVLGYLPSGYRSTPEEPYEWVPEAGDGTEWAAGAPFTPENVGALSAVLARRLENGKRSEEDEEYDAQEGYEEVVLPWGTVRLYCNGDIWGSAEGVEPQVLLTLPT